ncbi:hypothetical protein MMC22_010486 [Lobaria immixta]|nr:hypothetical protein [Lobaria immixta]
MALSQFPINGAPSLSGGASTFFDGSHASHPLKTVIRNVTIWDGEKTIDNTVVVVEGKKILGIHDSSDATTTIDGKGGFLMPGLIDSHVHAEDVKALECLAHYGISTAFDMGTFDNSVDMTAWHDVGHKGLTSLRFSGAAACQCGSFPCSLPHFPNDSVIANDTAARTFVQNRVHQGVDYLKIVINDDADPQPKASFQRIIKQEGQRKNKFLVSHAASYPAQKVAIDVGGKFITHLAKEKKLSKDNVQKILKNGQVTIPTLIMLKTRIHDDMKKNPCLKYSYEFAKQTVGLLHEWKVPILAGTDATKPLLGLPDVPYGKTIHSELKLLQEAGLSTEEVLRAATSLPAKYFNLQHRGRIRPGWRADLVLLDANPFEDIANSDRIIAVWTAGRPLKGPFGRWAEKCPN